MTDKKTEALKLALEAFDDRVSLNKWQKARDAVREALAEQPAQRQEPVAWMDGYRNIYSLEEKAAGCEDAVIPLVPATLQHWSDCAVHNDPAYPAGKCDCGGYTSPPQDALVSALYSKIDFLRGKIELLESGLVQAKRTWRGLTDEEIGNIWDGHVVPVFGKNGINPIVFARAIEAAHGIKENT